MLKFTKYISYVYRIIKSIKVIFLYIIILILLSGCNVKNEQFNNVQEQIYNQDMVLSALEGRIKQLEDENKKLREQIKKLSKMDETTEDNIEQISNVKESNLADMDLVKIIFRQIDQPINMQNIEALAEHNTSIYQSEISPDKNYYLLWISGELKEGDLYLADIYSGSLHYIGEYADIGLVFWSPNSKYVVFETKVKDKTAQNKQHSYILDIKAKKVLAEFDYASSIVWSDHSDNFVYIAASENILLDFDRTKMYTEGVYLFDIRNSSFSILDTGGADYICSNVAIDDNQILYVRVDKDNNKHHMSITLE